MKRFFGALLFAPACLGAQIPGPHAWFTTVGEIRATNDGWVEWRIEPPMALASHAVPPHHVDFDGIVARFAPDVALEWASAARRALADTVNVAAKTWVPRLTGGEAGISIAILRDSARVSYEIHARSCRGGLGGGSSRADVLLLVDAMTDAARVALALRVPPADPRTGPFSASEVTCAAWPRRVHMPAWSSALGRRPDDRRETLARFVITEAGYVDSSTLVWDRALPPIAERVARATLADWRFEPATIGGQRVRQWSHAQVWFADSTDAAEWQLAGRARTRSFVARNDGRIDHAFLIPRVDSIWRSREEPRIREAFTPSAVRVWLGSQSTPDQRGANLAAPGGFVRSAGGSYGGCPVLRGRVTGPIPEAAWPRLADSVRATLDEAERRRLAPIDSARVHGETEVTCPARPRERLAAMLERSPNDQEVVLSFVVERDGQVKATSAVFRGAVDGRDASLIRAALAAQRWEPGRLAGVRVPQRAHLVLHPVSDPLPSLATVSCMRASSSAARVRVREPVQGIASHDLTRMAYAISRQLAPEGLPFATDGTFGVVFDDIGAAHFFSWLRAPADSVVGRMPEFVFRGFRTRIGAPDVSFAFHGPVAVEVDLLPACP